MKKASISQTKNQLSALLDQVRNGETILVMDRNRPVARIVPVVDAEVTEVTGRLARLERAGFVRAGAETHSGRRKKLIDEAPPRPSGGGDVLASLLEERSLNR